MQTYPSSLMRGEHQQTWAWREASQGPYSGLYPCPAYAGRQLGCDIRYSCLPVLECNIQGVDLQRKRKQRSWGRGATE